MKFELSRYAGRRLLDEAELVDPNHPWEVDGETSPSPSDTRLDIATRVDMVGWIDVERID